MNGLKGSQEVELEEIGKAFDEMCKDIKDHVVYVPGLKVVRTDEEVRDSFRLLLDERNKLRQSFDKGDVETEYFEYRDEELSSKIRALGWVLGLESYLDAEL